MNGAAPSHATGLRSTRALARNHRLGGCVFAGMIPSCVGLMRILDRFFVLLNPKAPRSSKSKMAAERAGDNLRQAANFWFLLLP